MSSRTRDVSFDHTKERCVKVQLERTWFLCPKTFQITSNCRLNHRKNSPSVNMFCFRKDLSSVGRLRWYNAALLAQNSHDILDG